MKEYIKIQRDELLSMMKQLSRIFDIVRLVNPESTNVIHIDDKGIHYVEKDPCFAVWEKNKRCDNCISLLACSEKRRITKFEFRNSEIFQVVSMPVLMMDNGAETMMSMEMVNHVTEDMLFRTYGKGNVTTEIAKFNKLLYQDSLTGVYNRRYFDENMYLFDSLNKFPRKICFMMLDIRRFKEINDTYGHAMGDIALRQIALKLKDCVSKSDIVIRMGGDEFLVVLRNCDESIVIRKINEIRNTIDKLNIDFLGNKHLRIDIGYAYTDDFDGDKNTVKSLLETSDKNMYIDKNA